MNPEGSSADGGKKRSYASAELQESPTEVERTKKRSYRNVAQLLGELSNQLDASIENEIVLPLMKVYRYVQSNGPSSKVAKRKVDVSIKESESQQCAGPSNLLTLEKDEVSLAGAESKKLFASDQTSDSSNDENKNLCLPDSFLEDCKKLWNVEYSSVAAYPSAMSSILSIFRQLVYVDIFFKYICLRSERYSLNCRGSEISLVDCKYMLGRISYLEIDSRDCTPEQVFSYTDEEHKSKIVSLCGKEEVIVNVLLQLTKRILYYYFHCFSVFIREFKEFINVLDVVIAKNKVLRRKGQSLKRKKSSSGNLELLTYFHEMHRQIEMISVNLLDFLRLDAEGRNISAYLSNV